MTERYEPRVRPSPLLDDPEVGPLLRQATLEYTAELNETAAFRRLSTELARRSARRHSHQRRWPVLVVALLGGTAALALTLDRSWRSGPGAYDTIAPSSEPATATSTAESRVDQDMTRARDSVAPAREPEGSDLERAATPAPSIAPAATKLHTALPSSAPKAAPATKPERLEGEQAPAEPLVVREPAVPPPSVDCLALARKGEPRSAERCFSDRAQGSGLEAEMALYEAARLRVDVLDEGPAALSALNEHRQRFPRGALRREVDMFRVELLARLGRGREALASSEELLPSATGERAADLHLLRGNVYRQTLSDPAAAEREYARAEQLGGARGARATYLRGLCFEALGEREAAIASYQRYTSTPGQPQASDALIRLRRLEQSSSPERSSGGQP